jgi:hypothetical protein
MLSSGCGLVEGLVPNPAAASVATDSPAPPSASPSASPTRTPARSPTPLQTATATLEPTPDLSGYGECPAADASAILGLGDDSLLELDHVQKMADYLNAGGSPEKLIELYRDAFRWSDTRHLALHDLTDDGLPEVVYVREAEQVDLFVFVCRNQSYEVHNLINFGFETDPREPLRPTVGRIEVMRDLDNDGPHELVVIVGDARESAVEVFGWIGYRFEPRTGSSSEEDLRCRQLFGPSDVDLTDLDGDRIFELLLDQEIPIGQEFMEGLPWRRETRTCVWNGTAFEFARVDFARATYRFQAVQDGDRHFLYGEYNLALQAYQNGFIQNQLEWYSQLRKFQLTQLALQSDAQFDLTPAPELEEDTVEYGYLSAYSRFRTILLYLVIERPDLAEEAFLNLEERFDVQDPGFVWVEAARLFWDGYQNTRSLAEGCRLAVQFIDLRPDLLVYLGSGHHGWQSPVYESADICPISGS